MKGLFLLPLILALPLHAGTVSNLNDSGGGSLRDVIGAASPGETIDFDTALSGQTINLASQITITESVDIDATALGNGITIDAGGTSRVFEIAAGATVSLEAMTITGGKAPSGGTGSTGSSGGVSGIGGNGGPGGVGGHGGGIFNAGELTVRRVTVIGNAAGNGGNGGKGGSGLIDGPGGPGGNGGGGGGVHNSATGTLVIENSTITNNVSGQGGNGGMGLFQGGGGSGGAGGGIENLGTISLVHVTIVENTTGNGGIGGFVPGAPGQGGGLTNSGTLTLTNTLIALNPAGGGGPDLSGTIHTQQGVNFIGSGVTGSATLLTGDPMLGPLGDHGGPTQTKQLSTGSPAIDASSLVAVAVDQRGYSRDSSPDIGAVEFGAPLTVMTAGDTNDTNPLTLRRALELVEPGGRIDFDASLSGLTFTLTQGELILDQDVTIDASSLAEPMTMDANGAHRVIQVIAGRTVTLDSLILTGGVTPSGAHGGGIYNAGDLTLKRVSVVGNRTNNGKSPSLAGAGSNSGHGGGIYHVSGSLTIQDSLVSDNRTGSGGSAKAAGNGGGLYCNAPATIIHTTIANNRTGSGGSGAGSFDDGGNGGNGGGLYNHSDIEVSHTTITSNTVGGGGAAGGIFGSRGAAGSGAGLYQGATQTLEIDHCILGGNTGADLSSSGSITTTGVNLIGDLAGSGLVAGPMVLVGDPQLAPLGSYGGPTKSAPPAPGSPAIDAGDVTSLMKDQRGAPRVVDGDGDGDNSTIIDIGAVELQLEMVTTSLDENDSPPGAEISLREAIARNHVDLIHFLPALAGQTVLLTHGQLAIDQGVTIDASELSSPITIDANGASTNHRVIQIASHGPVTLDGLVITGGRTSGGEGGGGIDNSGDLTLRRTTIIDNAVGSASQKHGGFGGGIFHRAGTLTIQDSLIANNHAGNGLPTAFGESGWSGGSGGGIVNQDQAVLQNTTVVGNRAGNGTASSAFQGRGGNGGNGGGILNLGEMELLHCTLTNNLPGAEGPIGIINSPAGTPGRGGAVSQSTGHLMTLHNTVIADNSPSEIWSTGTVTTIGVNIISSLTDLGLSSGSALVVGMPRFLPLANYGGHTQTMPLFPGSLGIDPPGGDGTSTLSMDQRGFDRVISGVADVGAVEYQATSEAYWNEDGDNDGTPFLEELALGTNPFGSDTFNPANPSFTTPMTPGERDITMGIDLDAAPYTIWILSRSTDMEIFTEIYRLHGPTLMETLQTDIESAFTPPLAPTSLTITDQAPPGDRVFYQFDAVPAP